MLRNSFFSFKTIILFLFISNFTFAQDLIIKSNGDEVKAKIIEITSFEVKYKMFTNIDGPLYSMPKSEIFLIKYENGTKDVFEKQNQSIPEQQKNNAPSNSGYNSDDYQLGYKDASQNYRTPIVIPITSFASGLILNYPFPWGFATPLLYTLIGPNETNIGLSNPKYNSSFEYKLGYNKKAKSKRAASAWISYGAGCGTLLIGTVVVYAVILSNLAN